ncbi:MAG TPA: S-adenosylmethionine:tRNA ribosyltransferase-isomerase, partial [Turneriella sp.]|nr:S-adenosylmethionine:tRNA ribosyltransferase-isomerase [Turneriella sp.]
VLERKKQTITHDSFYNLGHYLKPNDAIFYNATRVEERRVSLVRQTTDKIFECIFLKKIKRDFSLSKNNAREEWQVLMRNIRRVRDGEIFYAQSDNAQTFIFHRNDQELFLSSTNPLDAAAFARIGEMPIPPYMQRAASADEARTYQNFFREQMHEHEKIEGSAASPTAALHFTPALYKSLQKQRIAFHPVCLDIGYGTFAPLTEENFAHATLHSEHYFIPNESALAFTQAARKIVLGTTALRALLSWQRLGAIEGETQLFIRPENSVTEIDGLITNFHLPQSSLLLLTAAFAGIDLVARAYQAAIDEGYRFFSYGDAMLIL